MLSSIPEIDRAVTALQQDQPVLLIDDLAPDTQCYPFSRADTVSAERINFFVTHGRSIICALITERRKKALDLPLMAVSSRADKMPSLSPQFTVSVEARFQVTTGISAFDRAITLRTLANTIDPKQDLVAPGHIFPIVVRDGGVLVASGFGEAAIDLVKLSGLTDVCAITSILDDNGQIADRSHGVKLAQKFGIVDVSVSDVVRHRMRSESIIELIAETRLPVGEITEFRAFCFRSNIDGAEHVALTLGLDHINEARDAVLTRVQSERPLIDLFSSSEFCQQQISKALTAIAEAGRGIFIFIRHPRQGLLRKQVTRLSQGELSSLLPMNLREYGIGSQIIRHFGVRRIKLLSNSERGLPSLDAFDISICERVAF